jgi:cytochrome d ubiquinol oxidase subunit I
VSIALGVLAVVLPLQGFIGDNVAAYVVKYKGPQALAMEGNWDSTNTGYNLIVIPNQGQAKNIWQVTVPWFGSAVRRDWGGNTPLPGLKLAPKALRPMMIPTFYGFHAMWFAWVLMISFAIVGLILRLTGRLYNTRSFHKLLVGVVPIGIIAIWGGWVVAETGRQPWIVYGKLLTAQAVSPLKPAAVLTSLIAFILIYLTLLGTYVWYVARVVRQGPEEGPLTEPAIEPVRAGAVPSFVPSPEGGAA